MQKLRIDLSNLETKNEDMKSDIRDISERLDDNKFKLEEVK
mgnify:FL=1